MNRLKSIIHTIDDLFVHSVAKIERTFLSNIRIMCSYGHENSNQIGSSINLVHIYPIPIIEFREEENLSQLNFLRTLVGYKVHSTNYDVISSLKIQLKY